MLVYVDDRLLIDHDPGSVMEELKKEYRLKNDAYGQPDRYLGAIIDTYECTDGNTYWSMSPRHHLKEAHTIECMELPSSPIVPLHSAIIYHRVSAKDITASLVLSMRLARIVYSVSLKILL